MADYYPLISRAVVGLKVNTEATRRVVYEGLRQAVFTQRGRRALEDAIRKVEMEVSGQSQSKEPHSAEQVEKEIKRLIRKRRAEHFLAIPLLAILLLILLGSLLYVLVGLEMLFIPRGNSSVITWVMIFSVILILIWTRAYKLLSMLVQFTGLGFIAGVIFVISGAIFFRIWSALH